MGYHFFTTHLPLPTSPHQVYRLINHIISVDYDIFAPSNLANWEATLEYFYKGVEQVEHEARTALDQCIGALR